MEESRAASAQRIGELASDPRFEGRQEDLQSLARALGDDNDTSWTGIDLIAAFPADASITFSHRQIFERALGVLAGISVFLPVGWTWYSLHGATQAYNDLLRNGKENGRTFLALWTTGFDGRLDGSHRLVPMALVSFALVLFAVASIVLHRMAAEVNVHREDKIARVAHRDLVRALLHAQRFLNERRSDDPRFLEAAVERSVKELNKAHLATRKGIEAMQAATQAGVESVNTAAAQLTGSMAPLLAEATTAGSNLAASAASAAAAETRITAFVGEVRSGLDDAMAQFAGAVDKNAGRLATETSSSLAALAAKVDQMAALHETLARDVAANVEASRSAAAEAAEVGRRATAALADASKASIADLSGSTKQAMTELAVAVRELQQVLMSHESALQGQASELTRAGDLSAQILSELRVESAQPSGRER